MYTLDITDEDNSFINCTDNQNEDNIKIIKNLLLSIPSCILLLCLICLNNWTILKLLFTNKQ